MTFVLTDLISPAYLAEQRRLHAQPRGYGGRGDKWAKHIEAILFENNLHTVIEYAAGQGQCGRELIRMGYDVVQYDPAVDEFCFVPQLPADMVVATDCLEHIEPDKLDAVIAHLRALTRRFLFTVISIVETDKRLSDGRQAHISLHDADWWIARLMRDFVLERTWPISPHKQIVALWRAKE